MCEEIGYGRVMQIAATLWRKQDPVGALTPLPTPSLPPPGAESAGGHPAGPGLSYGELLRLTEGHGTSEIYERIQALYPAGGEAATPDARAGELVPKLREALAISGNHAFASGWRAAVDEACRWLESLAMRSAHALDAAEMLWTVVANVDGGDWSKQSPEWQAAAARWRDNYLAVERASRWDRGPACVTRLRR